jgi:16S rRNA (cytidine1402-2'-O)-methyltransferase
MLKLLDSTPEFALVFYESPHRLAATLEQAAAVVGERRVAVAREISKLHESWYVGSASELGAHFAEFPPKGECTVVVEAGPRRRRSDG